MTTPDRTDGDDVSRITREDVADLIRAEHDHLATLLMAVTDSLIGADPRIKGPALRKITGQRLRESLAAREDALEALVGGRPGARVFPRRRCEGR